MTGTKHTGLSPDKITPMLGVLHTKDGLQGLSKWNVVAPCPVTADAIRLKAMNTSAAQRALTPTLIVGVLITCGCQLDSPPTPNENLKQSAQATNLPDWLTKGPSDWGDGAWLPYQASLIQLRAPILRSDDYSADELEIVTAEVEHWPGEYEDKIKEEWIGKWQSRLTSYERTGGCGCCNEVYTVTGPKVAMQEFPNQRESYPRFAGNENGE